MNLDATRPRSIEAGSPAASASTLNRWALAVLRHRLFPGLFQVVTVVGLAFIIYFALAGTIRPARNVATVGTWTLWWAVLPWSFLVAGRAWCAICPLGAISAWTQRAAGRLGFGPIRKPGAVLKRVGPWLMVITFVALAWVDRVFSIIGSPRATGTLLLVLLGGAVLVSLLYHRRVWCRYLCPLGALSGVYSMTAAVELRADAAACRQCRTKPCYTGNGERDGCPLYEFPQTMDSNRNCSLCGECVKLCPRNAIRVSTRPPGRELWLLRRPLLAEGTLGVVMVALVFLQTIDMTLPWGDYVKAVVENTPLRSYNVAFSATFGAVIVLALAGYLVASRVVGRMTGLGLTASLAIFGYAFVPLALAGHLGHNFGHLLLEGPAAVQVILSQAGLVTLPAVTTETVPDYRGVTLLALAVLLLGIAGAFCVLRRLALRYAPTPRAAWPQFALLTLFSAAYLVMFLLPMNPRHGH